MSAEWHAREAIRYADEAKRHARNAKRWWWVSFVFACIALVAAAVSVLINLGVLG